MREELASLSLMQFCTMIFRETGIVDGEGGLTPVQAQICDYLEHPAKRKVIAAFRGAGKSTLSAIYLLYLLNRNPNEKVLIVSASMSRAEAMSAWMLKTISDIEWLWHLKPDQFNGRYSRIAFDVGSCQFIEQSPSVRAAGITGQVTGSRASRILADDVESVQTALTQTQRMKLRAVINEFEAILKPGDDTEIVYLGTPHTSVESIYFVLRTSLNYEMRMWPARVPESEDCYKQSLAPLIKKQMGLRTGKPTDTRFSDDELMQRQLSMSPGQWRLQFMLDSTMSDAERYPLRCRDLLVISTAQVLPEIVVHDFHRRSRIVDLPCAGLPHDGYFYHPSREEGGIPIDEAPGIMTLDPSGGGTDEFALAVVKAWGGNYFLLESRGYLGGVNEKLWTEIAGLAKLHKVNTIGVETNFGGLEMYSQLLKPYLLKIDHPCDVVPIRSNVRKEMRIIDTLAPVFQTHRMIVDRRVIEADVERTREAVDDTALSYSLIFQMTRLTQDRGSLLHDDKIDAWAMAVGYFQEQAALDQTVQMKIRADGLFYAMLEDDMGHTIMSPDRMAMGMTLEQAKRASMGNKTKANWLNR